MSHLPSRDSRTTRIWRAHSENTANLSASVGGENMVSKSPKKKKSVIPAVASVLFAVFSLSVFYDIKTVQSFSTFKTTNHISRRNGVDFSIQNRLNEKKVFSTKLDTEVSIQSNDKKSLSRQRKKGEHNNKNSNKKYKDRKEQQQRERERRELKNKLLRARDSILYYRQDRKNDSGRRPSEKLKSEILPGIIQSYTSVIIQASFTSSFDSELFDPWEVRQVILEESRPVQERILGLLAVLMQVITHLEEECIIYNKDSVGGKARKKTIGKSTDQIRLIQSRLWQTCREILNDMLLKTTAPEGTSTESDNNLEQSKEVHVLSPIAVTALATSLRPCSKYRLETKLDGNDDVQHGSGVEEIKELIQLVNDARLAAIKSSESEKSTEDSENLDRALLHSWNCYLSSLCDMAVLSNNPGDVGLEMATNVLVEENCENRVVESDITSYNTVMGIAGKVGNATLVETVWQDLMEKREKRPKDRQLSLQPNSRTYNARLMVTNDFKQRLEILDKEILPDVLRAKKQNTFAISNNTPSLSIYDGFTIDLMLIPLLQADRKKQLFELIDDWMMLVGRQHNQKTDQGSSVDDKQRKINKNKAQRAFQNAMSAFFITLVQRNGDLRTARELWNRYMLIEIDQDDDLSTGDDKDDSSDGISNAIKVVVPERRHYNILLDGYARLVDEVRDRHGPNPDLKTEKKEFSKMNGAMKSTKIWNTKNDGEEARRAISTAKFYHEVQETAIRDGQNLFALMMAQQQQQKNSRNKVGSDIYTKSTLIRLCRSGSEVRDLLQRASDATSNGATRPPSDGTWLPRSVVRAAITTCGRLGDPSMACTIFEEFMFPEHNGGNEKFFSNYRAFNTLLGALANGAKMENPKLDVMPVEAVDAANPPSLLGHIHGITCTEAVVRILNLMTSKNAQTYCVAASALQYAPLDEQTRYSPKNNGDGESDTETTPLGLQIFHNATSQGIQADGRLVNAIFRCYGDDIAGALDGWKSHMRRATDQYEQRSRSSTRKNMLAAYNGLLYVCGRAERPDIAVRIVYAMKNKEGLEISENPYNSYRSGKTTREALLASWPEEKEQESRWQRMRLPNLRMVGQYENILYVECKKFDTRDRRMEKDKRVRIIV